METKKAEVVIHTSDRLGFRTKVTIRNKEGYYMIIKGSIKEDTTNVNMYVPNIGAPTYVKQILTNMKGEIYSNTIGNSSPYLYQWTDHSNRKSIKKQWP